MKLPLRPRPEPGDGSRARLVGHRAQQPGEAIGDPDMEPRLAGCWITHAEHLEGEVDRAAPRLASA